MSAREREVALIVIKVSIGPLRRSMTHLAIERIACRRVIWVDRILEIFQMATDTLGRCIFIRTGRMTLSARRLKVRADQVESGSAVVEETSTPLCGGMALDTIHRESGVRVIRIRR